MLDDRPADDSEYPHRNDDIITGAWCPSEDTLEEIIRQGRIPCEKPQRRQDNDK